MFEGAVRSPSATGGGRYSHEHLRRAVRARARTLFALLVALSSGPSCRVPPSPTPEGNNARETETPAPDKAKLAEPPKSVRIALTANDPDRWLTVVSVKKDAAGGWATGTFDEARNRLIIEVRDVIGFTVDTSRIPIRWDKLVVLSINGRKSELKKRDQQILHFVFDQHAQWVVLEP